MGYNNVGTPVFYVDHFLYNNAIGSSPGVGQGDWTNYLYTGFLSPNQENIEKSIFNLNPSQATSLLDYDTFPETESDYVNYYGDESLAFSFIRMNNHQYILDYDFSDNLKWYTAILNHNFQPQYSVGYADSLPPNFIHVDTQGSEPHVNVTSSMTDVLNGTNFNNGSSILTTDSIHFKDHLMLIPNFQNPSYNQDVYPDLITGKYNQVGSISRGIQYTMPHSPDLKLRMQYEMDGVETITTSSGGHISNINYTGAPLWSISGMNQFSQKTNPFEVTHYLLPPELIDILAEYDWEYPNEELQILLDSGQIENGYDVTKKGKIRTGRRTWNLKFSYINDSDLFSANNKGSIYTEHGSTTSGEYNEGDLDGSGNFQGGIETDNSFYAQVWNKTLGGALPFIFQPDSNNRDEFYICRFDQDTLTVTQSAHRVYEFSIKIVETW